MSWVAAVEVPLPMALCYYEGCGRCLAEWRLERTAAGEHSSLPDDHGQMDVKGGMPRVKADLLVLDDLGQHDQLIGQWKQPPQPAGMDDLDQASC